MRKRLIILAGLLPLAACAVFRPQTSWSDDLRKDDVAQIAGTIAALVVQRLPLENGKPIAIAPAVGITGKEVEALLGKEIEAHGYTLVRSERTPAEAHRLRFLISKYGSGYTLRVTFDAADATTAFSRMNGGRLVANAPLAIREAVR